MKKAFFICTVTLMLSIGVSSCEKEEKVPPAYIKLTPTQATAFNKNDGSISLEITGGQEPFYYFWSTGDSTQNISGLYAGSYSLKIIYGRNGSSVITGSARIEQPEATPLDLSFSVTEATSFGNPLGKIALTVSGGTPPYSYNWSTGDTVANLEKLIAGTYTIEVTDNGFPFSISTSGTAIVGQPEFVCGFDSITDIDGFKYATVVLGEQCWLASNLRTIHDPSSPDSLVDLEGRFCYSIYCAGSEGAHYTWDAMLAGSSAATESDVDAEVQGVCPTGWHIPTKSEFDTLDTWLKVAGNGGIGKLSGPKMKGESSSSGFDALLIGNYGYEVYQTTSSASYWTSTEYSTDLSQGRMVYITDDLPLMNKGPRPKNYGLSIRCVKNAE